MTTTLSHKQMAVNCFNGVWEYLELPERTKVEEEKMIHMAHSSFFHWTQVEDHTPKNLSIGYWQLSRVYAVANLGERFHYYAERCLEVSKNHNLDPFYLGYAYEALSRSTLILGQRDISQKYYQQAQDFAQKVKDDSSKEILINDLETIR